MRKSGYENSYFKPHGLEHMSTLFKLFANHVIGKGKSAGFLLLFLFISVVSFSQTYSYTHPCDGGALLASDILAGAVDGGGNNIAVQTGGSWIGKDGLTFTPDNENAIVTGFDHNGGNDYTLRWHSDKTYTILLSVGTNTPPSLNSLSAVTPPNTYLCASTDALPKSPVLNVNLNGGVANYTVRFETVDGTGTTTNDETLTSSSQNSTMNPISESTDYRIIYVMDNDNCIATSGVPSSTVSYTVFNPTVATVSGSDVCEGTKTTISIDNSDNGVTYELRRNGTTVVDTQIGNGGALNFADQSVTGIYEVYATDGTCDVQMNGSVEVYSTPNVYTASFLQAGPYCSSNSYNVLLDDSESGVTYKLNRDGAAVVSLAGDGNSLTFPSQNHDGIYTVIATNNVCPDITMTSNPNPLEIAKAPTVFNVTGGTACEDIGVTIGLDGAGGESGVTYELFLDGISQGTRVNNGNFGLQNSVGIYTMTGVLNGCSVSMGSQAEVNRLPVDVSFVTTGQVCPNGEVALQTSENGVRYELFKDGVTTGSTVNGDGNSVTFGVQNTSGIYTVVATVINTGCSITLSDHLEVQPQPIVYNLSANRITYCSSAALSGVDLTLSGSDDNSVTYQLYKDGNPEGGVKLGNNSPLGWQNVTEGTYYVMASNAGGCNLKMNFDIVITAALAPTATIATQIPDRRCANVPGTFNIIITLTGTPPFDFDIEDDKGSPPIHIIGHNTASYTLTVNPAATTTYSVTNLVDAASCLPQNGIGSATVYIDPAPVITFNPANPEVCEGSAITVIAYGAGVGGTYSWSDGLGNSQSINVAPAVTHTYSVTATTTHSCSENNSVTVTVNPLPVVDFNPPGNDYEYCQNEADVTLTGIPAGGSFSGTGILAASDIFSPAAANIGNNAVTYTYSDPKSCVNSITKDIVVNSVPNVFIFGLGTEYCANDGRVTFSGSPTAATGVFEVIGYTNAGNKGTWWDDNGNGTGWFDPTIATATVGSGTYTFRYTYTDPNVCTAYDEIDVDLHLDLNSTVSFTGMPAGSCQDDNTDYSLQGQVSGVDVVSGTFTGPNPGLIDGGNDGTAIFNPSLAGNGTHSITFTYTDANGCSGSQTQTIIIGTNLDIPGLKSTYCKDEAGFNIIGNQSPNGAVTLTNVTSGAVVSGFDDPANPGSLVFFDPTVLAAGPYTIEYSYIDGSGCTNSRIWDVEIYALPDATFEYEKTGGGVEITQYCVSETSVILTPIVVGGNFTGTAVSGSVFNPSIAGVGIHNITYTITQNGCNSANTRNDMSVTPLPTIDINNLDPDYCDNEASFTILASNFGTPGGVWTFSSTTNTVGVSPITDLGNGSATFDPVVGVGSYTVTMTYVDPAQGCENSIDKIVTIFETPEVNFGGANDLLEFCQDDSPITLTASFNTTIPVGAGVFTGDGITDNTDGTATFDPSGLTVGNHPITYEYTNPNSCVSTRIKTFRILEYPTLFTVSGGGDYCNLVGLPVGLSDSEVGVNYELLLNGLPLTPANVVAGSGSAITFGNQTAPGVYTVQAVNATSGCSVMMTGSVTIKVNDVTLVVTTTDVLCTGGNNGSATVVASGGTVNYNYEWKNSSNVVVATSATASNLVADTYQVTVIDSVGCSAVTAGIVINEPNNALNVTVINTKDVASCGCTTGSGICEGSAEVSITGGTPNYTVAWSTGSVGIIENDIETGNHSVTVTDNNGCIVTVPFITSLLPALTIVEDLSKHVDNTCNGGNIGELGVTVSGGSLSYEYSIDNTTWFSSPVFTGLFAGSYDVWVRDANYTRCSLKITNPIVITEPNALTLTEVVASHINVDCNGGATGQLKVLAGGGSGTYDYSIDAGATWQISNPIFAGLTQGSYNVWVRDAVDHGCINSGLAPIVITEPTPVTLTIASVTDVSCNGEADGVVVLTAAGGSGNYAYSIDGGTTWVASNTFSGLSTAGATNKTFQFSVKDASAVSCESINVVNATVSQPDDFSVIVVQTNVSCFGGNDGEITVTLPAALTGRQIEFSIDGANWYATGTTLTSLIAQNYKVSIRDAVTGCEKTDEYSVDITEPAAALIISSSTVTNVVCNSDSNGEVVISVSGGTAAYTYSWTNSLGVAVPVADGGNTNNPQNLIADDYTVIVTDANGCQTTDTYTLTEPAAWDVQYTATNVSVTGGNDGTISITSISGNSAPYVVTWADDNTNHNLVRTGLTAGSYGFTVVDANLCGPIALNIIITEPTSLTASVTGNDVTCFGGSDGSIDIAIASGNSPYVIDWSGTLETGGTVSGTINPANTVEIISSLEAGTYTVDVTDNIGNTVQTVVIIAQPVEFIATATVSDISCYNQGDGIITVNLSGPPAGDIASYQMVWNGPSGFYKAGTVAAEQVQNGLNTPGTYNISVFDDNSCPVSLSAVLLEPNELVVNVVDVEDVTCNGGADGEITIAVSGRPAGNGYTYDWYKWDGSAWQVHQMSATPTMINLSAGLYHAEITSAMDGCTAFSPDINVAENNALALNTTIKSISSCSGDNSGELTIDVIGGVRPYTLDYGNPSDIRTGNGPFVISGLVGGTYNITVNDANLCTVSDTYIITEPLPLVVNNVAYNIDCINDNTGILNFDISGGILDGSNNHQYFLRLSGLGGTSYTRNISVANGATYSVPFTNLPEGSYVFEVQDKLSSTPLACGFVLNFDLDLISITGTVTNASCIGVNTGAISGIAIDGTSGDYTYLWTTTDGQGLDNSSVDQAGLSAGTYNLSITDNVRGCTVNQDFVVDNDNTLIITGSVKDVTCNGGSDGAVTNISISDAAPVVNYTWTGPGVTNPNVADQVDIAGGTYQLDVVDGNGCAATETFFVNEPTAITFDLSLNIESCNPYQRGIKLDNLAGGTGDIANYQFYWIGPGNASYNSKNLTGLTVGGTYTVTVKDENNCEVVMSIVVPKELTITENVTYLSCNGSVNGAIALDITGGVGAFSYQWYRNGVAYANTKDIDNLNAATYTIEVTDLSEADFGGQCLYSKDIVISEPDAIALSGAIKHITCSGDADGEILLTVAGGTGNYSYSWSSGNGSGLVPTAKDQSGLSNGTYSVVVTDDNSCSATVDFTVIEPTAINFDLRVTDTQCDGTNGAIQINNVTGGSGTYTYTWAGPGIKPSDQNTTNATGLISGDYTVTVWDAAIGHTSCFLTKTVTLTSAIDLTYSVVPETCEGQGDGAITIDVQGGQPGYTYVWTTIDGSGIVADAQNQAGLTEGTYNVTITDTHGCSITQDIFVARDNVINVVGAVTDVLCYGDNSGEIALTISGGSGNYLYHWIGTGTGIVDGVKDQTGLSTGSYTVLVTDNVIGCEVTQTYDVRTPAAPLAITVNSITDILCKGEATGTISISVSGGTVFDPAGTPYYNYQWSGPGSFTNSPDQTNLIAGDYKVTVTDANECFIVSDVITITQPAEALAVSVTDIVDVTTFGGNDGEIEIAVSGGAGAYSIVWTGTDLSGNAIAGLIDDINRQTNLIAGNYNVDITDGNGCTVSLTDIFVNQPGGALQMVVTTRNIIPCQGDDNGQINVNVTGGTLPYTITWYDASNNQLGQVTANGVTIDNLTAGIYRVDITDANSVTISNNSIAITEPALLQLSTLVTQHVNCYESKTGIITLQANGGVVDGSGHYRIEVTGPNGYSNVRTDITEATDFDYANLASGVYNIRLTDDSNSDGIFDINDDCVVERTLKINQAEAKVTVSLDSEICIGETTQIKFVVDNWADIATDNLTITLSDGSVVVLDESPHLHTVTPVDNTVYTITGVSNGLGCEKGYGEGSGTVVVNPLPTARIYSNEEICFGETATLFVDLTGTSPWTVTWGDGTTSTVVTGIAATPFSFDVTPNDTTVYKVLDVQDLHCSNVGTDSVVVTVNERAAVTISGNADICYGLSTGIALDFSAGTAPYDVTLTENGVSKTLTGIIPDASGNYIYTVTPNDTAEYILQSVIDAKSCDQTVAGSVLVTVRPYPEDPGAITGDALVCQGAQGISYSIDEVKFVTNYVWTLPAGATIVSGGGSDSVTVDFDDSFVGGSIRVYAENGCAQSAISEMLINASLLPDAAGVVTGSANLCQASAGVMYSVSKITNATGYVWTLPTGFNIVAGDGTSSIIVDLDPTIANLSGVITVEGINSCGNGLPSAGYSVTVTPLPVAFAGNDEEICTDTYTLDADVVPGGQTGTWTILKGSGVIAPGDVNLPNATVTNLSQGENIFMWSVEVNLTGCSVMDTVTIFNNQLTVIAAVEERVSCDGTAMVHGTPIPAGADDGIWSFTTGNGTFVDAVNPSTQVVNLDPDQNILRWTITKHGCQSYAEVEIINDKPDQADISNGDYLDVCSEDVSLTANAPVEGTGLWTLVSGAGVIDDATLTTINVSGLSKGDNVLRWTIEKNGCFTTDEIVVRNNQLDVDAGTDRLLCDESFNLNAITLPTGVTGRWIVIEGAGTFDDGFIPDATVSGLAKGTNRLVWELNQNGCISTDTITLVNNEPTQAIVGAQLVVCADTVQLIGNTPTIGAGFWSIVSGSGKFDNVNDPGTVAYDIQEGINTYRWTITNNGCSSFADQEVENMKVYVSAGKDTSICERTTILDGNTPTKGLGEWNIVPGMGEATFDNINNPNARVGGLGYGNNVFVWTVTNATCISRDTVVISNNSPYAANAGTDQIINSDVTFLNATPALIGTGSWSLVSGGASIVDPFNAYTKINGIRRGPNEFRWTVEHLGCTSVDDVIITNGEVVEANAGLDQTICDNWTYLQANNPDVGIGEWSVVSGSGKLESPHNQKSKVYDLGAGVNVFRWTIYYTNSSSTDTVVITNNQVTVANAGPNRELCSDSFLLEANIPAIGAVKWTVISGSGTFDDNTNPNTVVNGLTQGANVLKYEVSQHGCSSVDSVTVYNNLPTIAIAGSDQTTCTDSVELHPNTPTFGTGEWRVEEGSAKFDGNWAKEMASGGNKLVWVITSKNCVSSDTVHIQNDQPSVAFAGHDRIVCVDSVNLSASIPQYGVGEWEFISGSGDIKDVTDPYSKVTGLSRGANRFRWTIDNNGCISSDDVEISNNHIPAIAGASQINCADTAVLEANLPSPGDGIWGVVGGSGSAIFEDTSNPYTVVRGLDQGDNELTWTINYMGCSSVAKVVIRNDNPTKAFAGDNIGLCTNTTELSANVPVIGDGVWTLVNGGGAFVDDENPQSRINNLKFGDNLLRWTITHNTCMSYDDVEVSFNRIDAVAGTDLITCSTDTILEANSGLPGVGTWSVVGGGTNQALFEDQNDPHSRVLNLTKGNNLLRWTVSYRGCDTFDEVNIVNNSPSTSYAGNSQELCEDNAVLDATSVVVGQGHWEILTGAASIGDTNDPKSLVSDLSKGDNVFRWTVLHKGCVSADEVLITNNRPSEPYAGHNMDICYSNTTLKADPPEYGSGMWSILQGSGNFSNPTDPDAQVENLSPGVNILLWTLIKGQCSLIDSIVVTNNSPTIANAGPDIQDCKDWSELDANIPNQGIGEWIVISGNGDFDDANNPKTTVRNLGFGENILMWRVSNNDCFSSDQVVIFNQIPDPSDAGSDRTICENHVVLNANNPAAGTGTWSVISGIGEFEDSHLFNTKVVNVGFGENVYKWTIAYAGSGCFTESTVTVTSNKAVPFAGDDDNVYEPEYQMQAANPGTLQGKWSVVAGNGDFDDVGFFSTTVRNLAAGKNTFRWSIDVDGCGAYDDVTIWFKEVPDAGFKIDKNIGCYPLDVKFTNYSVGGNVFYWDFGDGNTSTLRHPEHTYTKAGEFTVILTVPGPDGKDAVYTKLITAYDHPVADFDVKPTVVYMPGEFIRLYDLSIDVESYLWDFGDGSTSDVQNPSHEYEDEGLYSIQLTVLNEHGCEDVMLKEDVVEAKMKGFVSFANSFMPRPDGSTSNVNAIFKPVYRDVDSYILQIFNRWGQLIYESHDINEGWNGMYKGQLAPQAVYVWKASGTYISGKEFRKTGSVLLVR